MLPIYEDIIKEQGKNITALQTQMKVFEAKIKELESDVADLIEAFNLSAPKKKSKGSKWTDDEKSWLKEHNNVYEDFEQLTQAYNEQFNAERTEGAIRAAIEKINKGRPGWT